MGSNNSRFPLGKVIVAIIGHFKAGFGRNESWNHDHCNKGQSNQ